MAGGCYLRTLQAPPISSGPAPFGGLTKPGPHPQLPPRPFLRTPPAHSHRTAPFLRLRPHTQVPSPPSPGSRGAEGAPGPADLSRRELGDSFSLQPLQLGVDVGQSSLGQSQPLREARRREEDPAVDTPSPLGAFILPPASLSLGPSRALLHPVPLPAALTC